jgi:signal transduction histidine kinase/DNA-binding response OmpR family regulator
MANEHILLLEDHAETREHTTQILREANYYVQAASTGKQAIALAHQEPFDLIIADVSLPDGSGIHVFQEIRTFRPGIAGIVVTINSTWELTTDALRAGFIGFLVKPVVPEQLFAAVVSALEQEKLRHENARLHALVPLYELSRAFMGTLELDDLLHQVVATIQTETRSEAVSLMLLEDDQKEMRIAAAAGLPEEIIKTQKIVLGNGIAGRVAQRGEPLIIADGIPLDSEIRQAMSKPDIISALSLPIRSRGQVIGVLNLARMRGNDPFTPGDLELATVFVSQAAVAIDNARLFNQLKLLSEISQRLARTVSFVDACNIVVQAPRDLVHANGAALWLAEGSLAHTPKTFGIEPSQVPSLSMPGIEEFQIRGNMGWLTMPLRSGERNLGTLGIALPSREPLSEERIELVRTLAHEASAVIESHQLRERERLAFREVDRVVRSDLSLRDLLERLLDEIVRACDANGGAMYSWDSEESLLEQWVTQGTPVNIEWARQIIVKESAGSIDSTANNCCIIAAPMRIGHRTEGAIVLMRTSNRSFQTEHIDLLSTFASAATLAVRNAQLYARSEEAAIAEERTRIAREIHDGLAQNLSYLVLKIGAVQKLAAQGKEKEMLKELRDISDQLRRDARDVRRIIYALRPLDIETLGFLPALKQFTREFAQANDIDLNLQVTGETVRLSPKIEIALFRLTQETLNNIRKHAQAKHVWVDVNLETTPFATLQVRDDGTGFDLDQALVAARARGSVGLVQMRERAERAGGTFEIETAAGKGTKIRVQLPTRES